MRGMYFCTKHVIIYMCSMCTDVQYDCSGHHGREKNVAIRITLNRKEHTSRIEYNILCLYIYIRWCPQSFAKLLLVDY